ncbi:MFS transporter [Microbacterium thalassium]|uniref:MFS family permease n=1 Tax=Microbacterium thalassium TaxID=362649 RepID=A0A7X0FS97_9MICO|nr:MFS transporter [Microbacterium thalassium]MBB6392787.1 MFS family permease [Microbacterium thalassium]GLK22982.1 major facilitator superfamily protein [Microbacterium thalassium]
MNVSPGDHARPEVDAPRRRPLISPWRFIVTFGVVSLLADVVYEGARAVTGPILAAVGASAVVVGVVTGIGESAALLLRFVSGPLTDRTRRFWAWAITGYAITIISVPLLGYASVLWVAAALIIAERVGKAVRSPAKDAMLSFATSRIGRGRGFAVHEAIDQFGAVLGPLAVAGMLALTGGDYGPSLAVLAIPGIAVIVLLLWLRARAPQPAQFEEAHHVEVARGQTPVTRLPAVFWAYAIFVAVTLAGFATFGLVSFHAVQWGVVATPWIPVLYAAVMVVDALVALGVGWLYDRVGAGVLVLLPVIAAIVPALAFSYETAAFIVGALLWGAALGVQESTMRAVVADVVDSRRRGTAYGVFGAIAGVAAAIGGALAGWLYDISIPWLVAITILLQMLAVAILAVAVVLMRTHRRTEAGARR